LGSARSGPRSLRPNVVTHRSGGENSSDRKSPGRTTYDGLTLERGITHDLAFEEWANQVHPYAGDAARDLENYKKELVL
jgi:phage tail-like protein